MEMIFNNALKFWTLNIQTARIRQIRARVFLMCFNRVLCTALIWYHLLPFLATLSCCPTLVTQ